MSERVCGPGCSLLGVLRKDGRAAVEVRGRGGEEEEAAPRGLHGPRPRRPEERLAPLRHVVEVEHRRHLATVVRARAIYVPVVPPPAHDGPSLPSAPTPLRGLIVVTTRQES